MRHMRSSRRSTGGRGRCEGRPQSSLGGSPEEPEEKRSDGAGQPSGQPQELGRTVGAVAGEEAPGGRRWEVEAQPPGEGAEGTRAQTVERAR